MEFLSGATSYRVKGWIVQLKLLLLLLIYPASVWLLLNLPDADADQGAANVRLSVHPNAAIYAILMWVVLAICAIWLVLVLAIPVWSSYFRKRPLALSPAFRRGLLIISALMAIALPAQIVLSTLAGYLGDPDGSWPFGILLSAGAVFATIVLLQSGFRKQPGVYLTLRAAKIRPGEQSRLMAELRDVADTIGVPLPPHILVGLQAEFLWSTGTVFCEDGELTGGVLCLSLPTCSILSLSEFRALAGYALLHLHAGIHESRTQFVSTAEAAKDVLRELDDTMRQWSWMPKLAIHPTMLALWWLWVAAMRIPLCAGSELITYYVNSFCLSRQRLDVAHLMEAHRTTTEDVGSIQVITALIKEAAMSFAGFLADAQGRPIHALGEV